MSALKNFVLDNVAGGRWMRGLMALQGSLRTSHRTRSEDFHIALIETIFNASWTVALRTSQTFDVTPDHADRIAAVATHSRVNSTSRDSWLQSLPATPPYNKVRTKWLSLEKIEALIKSGQGGILDVPTVFRRSLQCARLIKISNAARESIALSHPSWLSAIRIALLHNHVTKSAADIAVLRLAEADWVAALAHCAPESACAVILRGLTTAGTHICKEVVEKASESSTEPAAIILGWYLERDTESKRIDALCRASRHWGYAALSLPVDWSRAVGLVARANCWDHVPSSLLRTLSQKGKDHLVASLVNRMDAQSDIQRTVNVLRISATSSKVWTTAISLALRSTMDRPVSRELLTVIGFRQPMLWKEALECVAASAAQRDVRWLISCCLQDTERRSYTLSCPAQSQYLPTLAAMLASGKVVPNNSLKL